MQVFAIVGMNDPQRVLRKLEEKYPTRHLVVDGGCYLVAASGVTTQELADDLLESNQQTVIAIAVNAYWGHHRPNVWEWIAVKGNSDG